MLTQFRLNNLPPHYILEVNFQFRYVRLYAFDISREKWLNCLHSVTSDLGLHYIGNVQFEFRYVRLYALRYSYRKMAKLFTNSRDPDQMLHAVFANYP